MEDKYERLLVPTQNGRLRYSLELGVNKPGDAGMERVCALEVGPFMRMQDARAFAMAARDVSAAEILDLPYAEAYDLPEYEIREQGYPIVGATLNTYSHSTGTTDNTDLY